MFVLFLLFDLFIFNGKKWRGGKGRRISIVKTEGELIGVSTIPESPVFSISVMIIIQLLAGFQVKLKELCLSYDCYKKRSGSGSIKDWMMLETSNVTI